MTKKFPHSILPFKTIAIIISWNSSSFAAKLHEFEWICHHHHHSSTTTFPPPSTRPWNLSPTRPFFEDYCSPSTSPLPFIIKQQQICREGPTFKTFRDEWNAKFLNSPFNEFQEIKYELACSDPSGRSRADFTLQMPPPSSNPKNNHTNGTAKENSNTPFLNPDTASSHS
jgi:hypothetical protein